MTYDDTVDYLMTQLPMFQKLGGKALNPKLDNIKKILQAIGQPHLDFQSVHIAGTNGKGTTAHMIAAALQHQGLQVGMYTSPHYKDYRERIKINGSLIEKEFIVQFVADYQPTFEEIGASFFEITVALAFAYFSYKKVDLAIIETGLGGRLDSTNVIMPLLSVITNISHDHEQFLGSTLQQIAAEKAGIIKYSTPSIIGEYQHEVQHVFDCKALASNSSLKVADQHSYLRKEDQHTYHYYLEADRLYSDIHIAYPTEVFLKNLTTALMAVASLNGHFTIDPIKVSEAISQFTTLTYYIGRYQKLSTSPLIIADSAHNKAGLTYLISAIQEESFNQLHIVCGFVKDKNIDAALTLLPEDATYYFCKADIPRGLDAAVLHEKAQPHDLHGKHYPSVSSAYAMAVQQASPNDLILICGSIFVVAEIL